MNDTYNPSITKVGDLAQLVSPSNKVFTFILTQGEKLHTHRGVVEHESLIGKNWGSEIQSHTGSSFILLQPSLAELLLETKRSTQIMYPKDIGYVLLKLGIGIGQKVIEAGTGSGALTSALAWFVGPTGCVISYDNREEMQNLARKNLDRLGLLDRVELKVRNIEEGFDESNVDAIFLDLPNPYDYLEVVKSAIKSGGNLGCILPTTPQVSKLLIALNRNSFGFLEVCEILLRFYKPIPERLRPTDRMVAHTGYLIFSRSMVSNSLV